MRGGLVGSRTLLCPGGAGALRPPGLAVTEKHCVQLPLLVPSWSCTSSCSQTQPPCRCQGPGPTQSCTHKPRGRSQESGGHSCLGWHLAQHTRGREGRQGPELGCLL